MHLNRHFCLKLYSTFLLLRHFTPAGDVTKSVYMNLPFIFITQFVCFFADISNKSSTVLLLFFLILLWLYFPPWLLTKKCNSILILLYYIPSSCCSIFPAMKNVVQFFSLFCFQWLESCWLLLQWQKPSQAFKKSFSCIVRIIITTNLKFIHAMGWVGCIRCKFCKRGTINHPWVLERRQTTIDYEGNTRDWYVYVVWAVDTILAPTCMAKRHSYVSSCNYMQIAILSGHQWG